MRDLKLLEAAGITKIELKEGDLEWPATRFVLSGFNGNVARMARMIEVPAYAAFTAELHSVALYRICQGFPTPKKLSRIPRLAEKVHTIMAEAINQDPDIVQTCLVNSLSNVNSFAKQTENVESIFESFLNGILIQAWATMEVLSKELLQNCVTMHPECFAHLTPEELLKLQTTSHQKLLPILTAYEKAFGSNFRNPLREQCVDALYLLRNLLSHKAGRIDDKFLGDCAAKYLTGWAMMREGSLYPTTGETVKSLVDPNLRCGYSLLRFVDQWLSSRKNAALSGEVN